MKSIFVPVFFLLTLASTCSAQCLMYQGTSSGPGTEASKHHCNLHGIGLNEGETYTNTTSCLKCHCGANHMVYCCAMLSHYLLPEGCVSKSENCVQEVVYESDGSPCQAIAAVSRK